jgi:hypothetical protein
VSDRDKSIGRIVDNGYPAQDWPEIGVMSAKEFGIVTESNLKGVPGLRLDFELCKKGRVDNRDVGATVCDTVRGVT